MLEMVLHIPVLPVTAAWLVSDLDDSLAATVPMAVAACIIVSATVAVAAAVTSAVAATVCAKLSAIVVVAAVACDTVSATGTVSAAVTASASAPVKTRRETGVAEPIWLVRPYLDQIFGRQRLLAAEGAMRTRHVMRKA